MKQTCYTYRILRFLFTPLFRLLYHPHVIGSDNIPATGAVILAGNHMHALDPILIDTSTKRIVRSGRCIPFRWICTASTTRQLCRPLSTLCSRGMR